RLARISENSARIKPKLTHYRRTKTGSATGARPSRPNPCNAEDVPIIASEPSPWPPFCGPRIAHTRVAPSRPDLDPSGGGHVPVSRRPARTRRFDPGASVGGGWAGGRAGPAGEAGGAGRPPRRRASAPRPPPPPHPAPP